MGGGVGDVHHPPCVGQLSYVSECILQIILAPQQESHPPTNLVLSTFSNPLSKHWSSISPMHIHHCNLMRMNLPIHLTIHDDNDNGFEKVGIFSNHPRLDSTSIHILRYLH